MINLTINQQAVAVPHDYTILKVANKLNIDIPTLCFLEGYLPFTSCMICMVEEMKSRRLLPACSALVAEGMVIETDNERIHAVRRDALELLLSEHLGDCEAPCQRICPAGMNIPLMIRQIAQGQFREAVITVKQDIALPAVLGRICPAPCENGCRRSQTDAPVSICLLKGFAADEDLSSLKPWLPVCQPDTGKKVAIIGAGPTGLAAAYYLRRLGHACHLFEKEAQAGGTIRTEIPEQKLPRTILDQEIALIQQLGVQFHFNTSINSLRSFSKLKQEFNAVVIACGVMDNEIAKTWGLAVDKSGLKIHPKTYQTSEPAIFAGGSAVKPQKMAVRSVGQGKEIASIINQFLKNPDLDVLPTKAFNSLLGRIQETEQSEFLKESVLQPRREPEAGFVRGFNATEAMAEAERCLHCDCRKPVSCKLRIYADAYEAKQNRYRGVNRKTVHKITQHAQVIYEPGKCIKCGLCVQITEKVGENLGLTFIGRGFNVQIAVPFNDTLAQGLVQAAQECVDGCPTGALAFKNQEEGSKNEASHTK